MEIDNDVYVAIGVAMVKSQRFEFLVHGLIAHFKNEILSKDKRFKGLDAKIFLSEDEEDKRKRKQTLGQMFEIINKEAKFVANGLDDYLKMRNTFVHNFWREYIKSNYNKDICLNYLIIFEAQTDSWINFFKGFLYVMSEYVYNGLSAEEKLKKIDARKSIEVSCGKYKDLFYNTISNNINNICN